MPVAVDKQEDALKLRERVANIARGIQKRNLDKIEGNKAVELIASTKGGTSIVQFKDMFNNFMGKIKKTP